MPRSFGVKRDPACPRSGKITDQLIHRVYHQMHINRCRNTVITQRRANHWANRQVRHVVIIHHIKMHNVGTSIENRIDFLTQASKVCGENRRCYQIISHRASHTRVNFGVLCRRT